MWIKDSNIFRSASDGDARAEQVRMRDQVHGHERAVAVARDTDALGIAHAQAHGLVDRGLRIGHELLEIRVVGALGIADDRERRVVDDRVAREQQQPVLPQPRERLLRARDLPRLRRVGIVEPT